MPQTRSKGAPASRIYSSSPAQQQVHFPSRRRTARTYGKQPTKRSLRQQTITQIDFLEPLGSEELDELEKAEEREFERRKRRKTEGDEVAPPEEPASAKQGSKKGKKGGRKTEGDVPISTFHTQTLTQLYGDETMQEPRDEDGAAVGGVEGQGAKSPSVIPQTPLKQKTRVEIPSSQPSPCTPMLARYSPLGPRTSPLKSRSTNVRSRLPAPGEMEKTPRRLVIQGSFASGVTVESGVSQASVGGVKGGDSSQRLLSSGGSRTGAAASQRSGGGSGRKRVFQRVEIPDSDAEDSDGGDFDLDGGDMTTLTIPDTPTKPQSAKKRTSQVPSWRSPRKGLETSTDEQRAVADTLTKQLDSGPQDSQRPSGQTPREGLESQSDRGEAIPDTPSKRFDGGPETGESSSWRLFAKAPKDAGMDGDDSLREDGQSSYPVGPHTQFAMGFIASSKENIPEFSGHPRSSRRAADTTHPSSGPSSRPAHKSPATKATPQRKKPAVVHFSSPDVSLEDEVRSANQHRTQAYTQMGSQRVDFDVIRSMPAATGRSDVFISIRPEYVQQIVDGTKDHEFRTWKLPVTVCRIWIYVTKPESRLRYMACVGPAKERGQIEDERGLGNAEFNRGEGGASFAHEILELYELNNPVSLNRMRQNGWLEAPPQKFTFVPPVVVSQLQANLRCRVLPRDEDGDELQDSGLRDSQEVEAQLLSDIAYSTQRPVDAFSQGMGRSRDDLTSSVSHSLRSEHGDGRWQAELEDQTGGRGVVPSSQATTASDDSIARPPNSASGIPVFHDSGSPVRMPEGDWEVDTSQLVGSSQLLPDTLLRDRGPPEDFNV